MNAPLEPHPLSPMPPPDHAAAAQRRFTLLFLVLASAAALYVCYIMARPFVKPVVFAAVMAIVFFPLHDRIWQRVRGPNLAALLSTLVVLLIVIIPVAGLGGALTGEMRGAYQSLSQKSAAGGGWVTFATGELQKVLAVVGRHVDLSRFNLRAEISTRLEQLSAGIVRSAADAVTNLGTFLFDAAISFFTLFFLFRDGRRIRLMAAALLPLDSVRVEELFTKISDTIIANVYGVLAVAVVQGTLIGLAFAMLGIRSPILWGVVTAICSLVPLVGTGLVWLPAAVVLAVSGHWVKGLILLAWGGGFVSLVDHAVRPYVIGERVKMNTLFVFFALLGGIEAFGIIGIFVGPLALSIASALLHMLREETRLWRTGAATEASVPAERPAAAP
ncbi:MAG TPA: AI-2E family transporter [Terriglobia bacterium]|nr:AI-2E family transporter [Terriglobia bacterium]